MGKVDALYLGIDRTYRMATGTVEDMLLRNTQDRKLHSLAGNVVFPVPESERHFYDSFKDLEEAKEPERPLKYERQMTVFEENSFWPVQVTAREPDEKELEAERDAFYEKSFQKAVASASREDAMGGGRTTVLVVGAVVAVVGVLLLALMVLQVRFF